MTKQEVIDFFNFHCPPGIEVPGEEKIAIAILTLAVAVGENRIVDTDGLSHAICMGVRKGLFGSETKDNAGLFEVVQEFASQINEDES